MVWWRDKIFPMTSTGEPEWMDGGIHPSCSPVALLHSTWFRLLLPFCFIAIQSNPSNQMPSKQSINKQTNKQTKSCWLPSKITEGSLEFFFLIFKFFLKLQFQQQFHIRKDRNRFQPPQHFKIRRASAESFIKTTSQTSTISQASWKYLKSTTQSTTTWTRLRPNRLQSRLGFRLEKFFFF